MDIEQLVHHENEHTALDFKAVQYTTKLHQELLADVLAFANAQVEGSRHIIVGVKHHPNGERQILGIPRHEFIDQSNYQQLVQSNVEPPLTVTYEPYELDGKFVGVLSISGCDDQPYLMKKDYGGLKLGDSFIRKGATRYPLTRTDLDRIYEQKARRPQFDAILGVSFDNATDARTLTVSPVPTTDLPSERAAARIRAILAQRRSVRKTLGSSALMTQELISNLARSAVLGGPTRYEDRTDQDLENNLANVKETYREDDIHEVMEVRATKVNLYISNAGSEYVEDASVKVTIPAVEGLFVADQVYEKPVESHPLVTPSFANLGVFSRYPHVKTAEGNYLITAHVGNIKHQETTAAFDEPLRIVVTEAVEVEQLAVRCQILAKNLPEPVTRELTLVISPQKEERRD